MDINSGGMHLALNSAITCGLLLNELITNSIKYAFPGDRKGKIRISLSSVKNRQSLLKFSDNGVGFPEGFDITDTKTFGLELVRTLVNQLEGELEIRNKKGVEYRIKFHQ